MTLTPAMNGTSSRRSKPRPIGHGALWLLACLLAARGGSPAEAGLTVSGQGGAEEPSAEALLARSIAHHDPDERWRAGAHRLVLDEVRPDGRSRQSTIVIDNRRSFFDLVSRRDGRLVEFSVHDDEVEATLDGSRDFSPEAAERYNLGPDRARRMRNYYTYLYGLPMKLGDPGVRLDPDARFETFQGRDVYALRVTYDEAVGRDTWYFYLDRDTCALVGYQFFHDESQNDGEYIVLEEEAVHRGVRLPKVRRWYMNQDNRHLGTDTITSFGEAVP